MKLGFKTSSFSVDEHAPVHESSVGASLWRYDWWSPFRTCSRFQRILVLTLSHLQPFGLQVISKPSPSGSLNLSRCLAQNLFEGVEVSKVPFDGDTKFTYKMTPHVYRINYMLRTFTSISTAWLDLLYGEKVRNIELELKRPKIIVVWLAS